MNHVLRFGRAAGAAVVLGVFGGAVGACSKSVPESLCKTICDCEHCGSQTEDLSCAKLETDLKVATDYGCDDRWNAWANCKQGQGTCIEVKATFSTAEPGQCSNLVDIGLPCAQTSDCAALQVPGTACVSGRCQAKQCKENGQLCTEDIDCPTGQDKCLAQLVDLATCEAKASGHPGTFSTGIPSPSSPGTPGIGSTRPGTGG